MVVLADFTVDNLAGLLSNDTGTPPVDATAGPFDQVVPALLDRNAPIWSVKPEAVLIWTRPERISETFARLSEFESVEDGQILAEVDQFASLIGGAVSRGRFFFVASWVIPGHRRGRGLLDRRPNVGATHMLDRMNIRLAERLATIPNVYLLDTSRWVQAAGKRAFNPKLWYLGKVSFSDEVLDAAVADIKAALVAAEGGTRKLVVVDLDDTLWGGIIGDVGADHIRLGGHDPIGEAYADFQRSLKALTNRGILLGIVSKNEEATALEAIRNHPEMVLRTDSFAGWRINWSDKAKNLAELVEELNLGLQSVVFIDDNPVERDRVRGTFPEVLVPEWPSDPMLYAATLRSMTCFDTATVSAEDSTRAGMYAAERKRRDLQDRVGSVEDWLHSLGMKVTIEPPNEANRERTVQLLNKTNQMNLSTRRLSESELAAWLEDPRHSLWTFRVADKYGDSGLTGILSCATEGSTTQIVDFVLSCRVMGRRVEETMLHAAVEHARERGAVRVVARPIPTAKNKPCRDFFENSSFERDEQSGGYRWDTAQSYPLPETITVVRT